MPEAEGKNHSLQRLRGKGERWRRKDRDTLSASGTIVCALLLLLLLPVACRTSRNDSSNGSISTEGTINEKAKREAHQEASAAPPQGSLRVMEGDHLKIENARGNPIREVTVTDDGTIRFPQIGPVVAAGKTPRQLGQDLARAYGSEIDYVNVVVYPTSRYILVTGEVNEPGRYPYSDDTTVDEAIANAGGVTDFAYRGGKIRMFNPRSDHPRSIDLRAAIEGDGDKLELSPGDRIFVPKLVW